MSRSPLLIFHICTAILGLLSGWAALLLRKGSRRHRAAGSVFVISMLSMCASALCIALMKEQSVNVIAGSLTFYLVATAWLTTRRKAGETGRAEFAAMFVASAIGVAAWILGWQRSHSAMGPTDGIPTPIFFVFGSVALLSAAGDVRMLIRGGVSGAQRIIRHLWRMCFALFIAQASAFSGTRTEIFPEAIRKAHLLKIPIIAIVLLMIFWLCRVWFTNAYKRRVTAPSMERRSAHTLA
jgi:uncharacterized membrane protein